MGVTSYTNMLICYMHVNYSFSLNNHDWVNSHVCMLSSQSYSSYKQLSLVINNCVNYKVMTKLFIHLLAYKEIRFIFHHSSWDYGWFHCMPNFPYLLSLSWLWFSSLDWFKSHVCMSSSLRYSSYRQLSLVSDNCLIYKLWLWYSYTY